MKALRVLQKIVGVLSLLVVLCVLVAAICVGLVQIFDLAKLQTIYDTAINGFNVVANFVGLADLAFLVPLLAYVLPAQLLLIAGILMFLPYRGKQGKYTAANILSLIGIAIFSIFTLLFAADLVANGEAHIWFVSPFSWTAVDTIVRYVALGLLALLVLFIGLALGIKPKNEQVTETVVEDESAVTEGSTESVQEEETVPFETVAPSEEQPVVETESAPVEEQVEEEQVAEYVPIEDASVAEITNSAYGTEEEITPEVMDKINKARMFYEMGAITQDEYIKLVQSYLRK